MVGNAVWSRDELIIFVAVIRLNRRRRSRRGSIKAFGK